MLRTFLFLAAVSFLVSCNNDEQAAKQPEAPAPDSANKNLSTQQQPAAPQSSDSVNQSLVALEKRYALVPSDPALAFDLAYAYAEAGNAKVLRMADSLVKARTPEIEKAYYVKADYYSRTNNVKEALRNYNAAIAANLHFLDAQIDKGRLLFHQKQYEEALKTFATGQKIAPAEPMFYFWVAKTQEAMGNKADAKTNYKRAYALDKTLTEARQAAEKL